MNKIVITLLIIFVIYSLTRTEKFTNVPPDELNDEEIDLSGYEESDLSKIIVLSSNMRNAG